MGVNEEKGLELNLVKLKRLRATALSVHVVRAFVELRGLVSANKELASQVHALERKVSVHDRNIAELVDSMSELLTTPAAPPKRPIGFVTPEDKPKNKPS